MIRRKKLFKVISVFVIITFLNSIIFPAISHAVLTSGEHQAEYTSYESNGGTDMVNLLTGDFTYTMPLLSVPGPGGGFSIPLSYHAGIGLNQEASWVGLGWSLNCGSLLRDVSNFPDDFNGQMDEDAYLSGSETGHTQSYILYTKHIHNNKNVGGSVSLLGYASIGWGTLAGFDVMGVSYSKEKGLNVDVVGIAVNAALKVAGMGVFGEVWSEAANTLGTMSNYLNIAGTAMSFATSMSPSTQNINHLVKTTTWYGGFLRSDYETRIIGDVETNMYGSLYSDITPVSTGSTEIKNSNGGTTYPKKFTTNPTFNANDVNMYIENDNYALNVTPTVNAYDNYSVMGPGISGNIQPYRHEVTNIANKTGGNNGIDRYRLAYELLCGDKVNFRYKSEIANTYTYHKYGDMEYGADITGYFNPIITINDEKLEGYKESDRIAGDGLKRNHLAGDKYVTWYTNDQIKDGVINNYTDANFTGILMDFLPDDNDERTNYRNSYYGTGDLIGGFSVTADDGMTYHYTLPVYNSYKKTLSIKTSGSNLQAHNINNNNYATTWLLTGITGPDFIDRDLDGYIDEDDWGYWVKFEYGKFSLAYKWRIPYTEGEWSENPDSPDSKSYMEGRKETYYLNEIKTKTHTALFVKSERVDGESAYLENYDYSSSLRLDNIYLVKNEDYNTLLNDLNLNMNNSDIANGSWDVEDFNSSVINNYLTDVKLKHIHFDYDYSLCENVQNNGNVINGNTNNKGKLTLNKIQFYGPDNYKLMPDYIFDYNSDDINYNPNYYTDLWDGWGIVSYNNHHATQYGYEWSLKKITTPLGSELSVDYERDTYSSVSGFTPGGYMNYNSSQDDILYFDELYPFISHAEEGDIVTVSGKYQGPLNADFDVNMTIEAVYNNKIVFTEGITEELGNPGIPLESQCVINSNMSKYGGDLRVSKINVKDENENNYKTLYIYTVDSKKDSKSSGVCSVEPKYSRIENDFYSTNKQNLYDYPVTPVIYGKVTVLKGKLTDDNNNDDYSDFEEKDVYEFITPDHNMVQITEEEIEPTTNLQNSIEEMYNFKITDNTSQIGTFNSIKRYKSVDHLISSQEFLYTDDGFSSDYGILGQYTQGTFLFEALTNEENNEQYKKLYRTTIQYNPNIPITVETTDGYGNKTTITNTEYDFLTGKVLETEYVNTDGNNTEYKKIRTTSTPAYTISDYSTMGSKVDDPTNKNMLTQEAYNMTQWWDETNSEWKVLSAGVQTWNDDWKYRYYDDEEHKYIDPDSYDDDKIWRKHKTFVWKGDVNSDGTYKPETPGNDWEDDYGFNWTLADLDDNEDYGWQKTSEVTRYNHYSVPLEVMDINENYASTRLGYPDNRHTLASCANANYLSFTYSGFENKTDRNGITDYDGEVLVYPGYTEYTSRESQKIYAHTGDYGAKVTGAVGPMYKASISDLKPGKYRTSVWVHEDSDNTFRLEVAIENGQTSNITETSISKAGNLFIGENTIYEDGVGYATQVDDWILLSLNFEIEENMPAGSMLQVYTTGSYGTSTGYIDDFRVHPVDAPMTANVYDHQTGQVTAILDNENFATFYTYDDAGRLTKVERETIKYGKKTVSEYDYHYALEE